MRLRILGWLFTSIFAVTVWADDVKFQDFVKGAKLLQTDSIRSLRVQNRGRLKPLETLAQESILFLTGSSSFAGLEAIQLYLALIDEPHFAEYKILEIRDADLRVHLGLQRFDRFVSLAELDRTPLVDMAGTLTLNGVLAAEQKKILEISRQALLLRHIQSGEHLAEALDLDLTSLGPHMRIALKGFLLAVRSRDSLALATASFQLKQETLQQKIPSEFVSSANKIDLEVMYNHLHLFLWAALGYFLVALILQFQLRMGAVPLKISLKIPHWGLLCLYLIPIGFHLCGFALRVILTGFAPVTNMYGTLLWVAFGLALFSLVLLQLYSLQKTSLQTVSLLALGSALLLVLSESFPLSLSADMDPIVAVLRSNYWLTLHVLTITISYAALTIAMLIGNAALIRVFLFSKNIPFEQEYSHYAYRMIQLGCFLLTVGIIFGGIWADSSWGRFWGWDPKETWALIADLGFLALLHARFVGWIRDFSLLAWSTIAYLLVVMAWYGVNFVLASGLHSYGFSSGGALAVASFVTVQLGLFMAALLKHQSLQKLKQGPNQRL